MSFDELKGADVTPKKKDIDISVDDKLLKFTANEISYLQRLNLATIQNNGGDPFTSLVVYSIKDENGKHMTFEQAKSLKEEHIRLFLSAANEVNYADTTEKN